MRYEKEFSVMEMLEIKQNKHCVDNLFGERLQYAIVFSIRKVEQKHNELVKKYNSLKNDHAEKYLADKNNLDAAKAKESMEEAVYQDKMSALNKKHKDYFVRDNEITNERKVMGETTYTIEVVSITEKDIMDEIKDLINVAQMNFLLLLGIIQEPFEPKSEEVKAIKIVK